MIEYRKVRKSIFFCHSVLDTESITTYVLILWIPAFAGMTKIEVVMLNLVQHLILDPETTLRQAQGDIFSVKIEPLTGLEPATCSLRMSCSTTELKRR